MGRFTEKLKSVLMHDELPDVPAKQVDRWEGEGGWVPPAAQPPRKFRRRNRQGEKPVDGEQT